MKTFAEKTTKSEKVACIFMTFALAMWPTISAITHGVIECIITTAITVMVQLFTMHNPEEEYGTRKEIPQTSGQLYYMSAFVSWFLIALVVFAIDFTWCLGHDCGVLVMP